ncbi:MAG: ATP-binding protein, partial [Proteobacteria bacterium]|nr:ATP-binding protein [Pseudomonadota bacterium]
NKSLKFFITGSSARKLKRGGANLLPGRVIAHRLGPFVAAEFDYQMNTKRALEEGTLPEAYLLDREHETRALLRSYAAIYLKEEVKAEALVRNLEAFGRFFSCISMSVAGFVDYTKLARRAKVSRHSIPNYFEILEDTLIGERLFALPDFHRLDLIRHPRFYLFDNGVFNALMGNFTASPDRIGTLAEQLVYSQIRHSSWSRSKDVKIHTFRERSGVEVDFVVEIDGTLNAIEVKASERIEPADLEGLEFFDREVRHPSKRLFVFHLGEKEYQFKKAWALPWQKGLKEMGL